MTKRPVAWLLVLLLFYLGVTIWLTWPLGRNLTHKLPCTDPACTFDTRFSAWVLAWQSHALATEPSEIGNANIYHPAPDALYYGPTGFGAVPYFAPTFLATGDPALATNLMLLLSVALAALSLHWVVRRWTGLESAGLVAASTLLVCRWYLWGFVAATPHLAPLQYFPLIVFLAAAPLESAGRAALLVALIVVQCLTDLVYVAAAVMAPLALLAASRLVRGKWRRSGVALAGCLAAAIVCLIPFLRGYLRVRAENPLLGEQTLWKGGVPPSELTSLFWRYTAPTTVAPAAIALICAGALIAMVRRRRLRLPHDPGWGHGALWLFAGAMISISPSAEWNGSPLYVPQDLLAATTPLYAIIRAPWRLGVAAMIGACILSGIAFAELMRALERGTAHRIAPRLLRGVLAGVAVCLLYVVRPVGTGPIPNEFPLQNAPEVPPSFLPELVGSHGPLLQLPALKEGLDGWPSSSGNAYAMYLSTFHWRVLLNGYSSYWPAGFIARMEVAEQLPARAALARLVDETDLAMIWVDLRSYVPAKRQPWREAELGRVRGLELRAADGGQLLFAVDRAALRGERNDPGR